MLEEEKKEGEEGSKVICGDRTCIPFPVELVGVKVKVSSRKLSSSRLREVGGGSGEGSLRDLLSKWEHIIITLT